MRVVNIVTIALVCAMAPSVVAQTAPRYDVRRLNGAVFMEQVHTDVVTQSGSAERERIVVRTAQFGIAMHGDTLAVTTDALDLRETADGVQRAIDVDAVVGGRWKLTLGARGDATVITQPFVPGEIGDVSDIAIAMHDFFPPAPPSLTAGKRGIEAPERTWRRLADSAGLSRYRWSDRRQSDSSYVAGDSVPVRASVGSKEDGDVAWDIARGPIAWSRHIATTATSRFAGRTNRAVIDQRIVVRRLQ